MYQTIPNRKQCINCLSTNSHTFERRTFEGSERIIKCLDCNHEKVLYKTTTASSQNNIYNIQNLNNIDNTF